MVFLKKRVIFFPPRASLAMCADILDRQNWEEGTAPSI